MCEPFPLGRRSWGSRLIKSRSCIPACRGSYRSYSPPNRRWPVSLLPWSSSIYCPTASRSPPRPAACHLLKGDTRSTSPSITGPEIWNEIITGVLRTFSGLRTWVPLPEPGGPKRTTLIPLLSSSGSGRTLRLKNDIANTTLPRRTTWFNI